MGISRADEETIMMEKRLLANVQSQTNTLVGVKEAAQGIQYTQPMPSTFCFSFL